MGASQRRGGRGPKGYKRTDERIKEDLYERLMNQDIDASEVTVEVKEAKVTLEGTVPERWMKHTIEDVADGCHGVQDVENRIRVQSQSSAGSSESGGSSIYGSTASTGAGRSKKE
jgi:osmotically-inducible protein OsmY